MSAALSTPPSSVAVVGGGIVGLAVARRLLQLRPGAHVVVFEKEAQVATHQTGHNSGVLHAGVYYAPGSLKATLCRRGGDMMREYCASKRIPVADLGKVIVARHRGELAALERLWERASANGVPGLQRLGAAGLADVEPHVSGIAALHSPRSAVVDFAAVARAFASDVEAAGGEVRVGTRVYSLAGESGRWRLACTAPADTTGAGDDTAGAGAGAGDGDGTGDGGTFQRVVVCAGLGTDELNGAGRASPVRTVPFRGHYYRLAPRPASLVRGLVYPVPDPRYPFLGIHLTPRADGEVLVGPNAVLAFAAEGYRWSDVDLGGLLSLAAWPGSWRMARQHWRTGVREFRTALSRAAFASEARSYVPAIADEDLLPAPAGVRAQAVDRSGSLVDDFVIDSAGGLVVLRNAPSPAATSSLAIAEHVAALV